MLRGSLNPFATTSTRNPGITEGEACCGAIVLWHASGVVEVPVVFCALAVNTADDARANKCLRLSAISANGNVRLRPITLDSSRRLGDVCSGNASGAGNLSEKTGLWLCKAQEINELNQSRRPGTGTGTYVHTRDRGMAFSRGRDKTSFLFGRDDRARRIHGI